MNISAALEVSMWIVLLAIFANLCTCIVTSRYSGVLNIVDVLRINTGLAFHETTIELIPSDSRFRQDAITLNRAFHAGALHFSHHWEKSFTAGLAVSILLSSSQVFCVIL